MKKSLLHTISLMFLVAFMSFPARIGAQTSAPDLSGIDCLYLFGSMTGYLEPSQENADYYSQWKLSEISPGSRVFKGTFTIPGSEEWKAFSFRLYSDLNGWDSSLSIGWSPKSLTRAIFVDKSGSGAMAMENNSEDLVDVFNWATDGEVTFTFELDNMKLYIQTDPSHASERLLVTGVTDPSIPAVSGNEYLFPQLWLNYEAYTGSFYIPEGSYSINFMEEFTDNPETAPVIGPGGREDVELEFLPDGIAYGRAMFTKRPGMITHWNLNQWAGGEISVSAPRVGSNEQILFYSGERASCIYFIGDPTSWATPSSSNYDLYKDWVLPEIAQGVYEGDFFIEPFTPVSDLWEDNGIQFRFMTALRGWISDYSLGSYPDDFYAEPTPFVDGVAKGYIVEQGLGNWLLEGYHGGSTLRFRVNLNDRTLTVTDLSSGLELNVVAAASVIAVPGGVRVSTPAGQQVTVYSVTGALVKAVGVPAGDTVITLPAGFYIVNGQKVAVR